MKDRSDQLASQTKKRLGPSVQVRRVKQGLIFKHRNAQYFLAEVDLEDERLTVPVATEFSDHPDCEGDELVALAMKELKPRLQMYRDRGYRLRETEWRPAQPGGSYDENKVPVFVAFMDRPIGDWSQLDEELTWLLDQLTVR